MWRCGGIIKWRGDWIFCIDIWRIVGLIDLCGAACFVSCIYVLVKIICIP